MPTQESTSKPGLECQKCRHEWTQHSLKVTPRYCPKCHCALKTQRRISPDYFELVNSRQKHHAQSASCIEHANRVCPYLYVRRRLYPRISSPKGHKTTSQRAELEAWVKRQRLKGVQWFEDRETGKHLERPAFQRMQAAIFAGSIDTVIVWKLDRLARRLKDGINTLATGARGEYGLSPSRSR